MLELGMSTTNLPAKEVYVDDDSRAQRSVESGMDRTRPRIRLYPQRGLAAFLALISMVIVAAGVLYAIHVEELRTNLIWYLIVVCLLVPLFFLGGVSALISVASNRPAFIVDEVGIRDDTTLFGAGRVNWEEIEHITTYRVFTQRYLVIVPRNVQSLLAREPLLPRVTMWINDKISPAPINIPAILLAMPADELIRQIQLRFEPEIQLYKVRVA